MGSKSPRIQGNREKTFRDPGIDPFTYKEYRYILETFKKLGYESAPLPVSYIDSPRLYLRHDVDADLDTAGILSKIEATCGFRSTFFIMLSTSIYNIFNEREGKILQAILDDGNSIGLHFDSRSKLSPKVHAEMLSNIVGKIDCMSYHQTRHEPVSNLGKGDLMDVSPQEDWTDRYEYRADSYGEWRYGHPLDQFDPLERRKSMYLNCHPLWWGETYEARVFKLGMLADRCRRNVCSYLAKHLAALY